MAGTDISKTTLLYGDEWREMVDFDKRISLEEKMQNWSNDVFCVMARLNVNRASYCFRNLLIIGNENMA